MKIYENRNKKKRTTLCSYCGGQGHLWMACPHTKSHFAQIKRKEPVDITIFTGNHALWATCKDGQGNPQPRTRWLNNNATEFYNKQLKRLSKENKKNKQRRRCGFCSSPSHNRRNCKLVQTFVKDMASANQRYRSEFYEVFVNQLGIAEGALVEIRSGRDETTGQLETSLGLIQRIDWDSINLTLDQPNKNWEYASTFELWVVVDGKTIKGANPFQEWLNPLQSTYPRSLCSFMKPLGFYDDAFQILSILSQSSNKPSEGWFIDGYDNGWEWLCKTKTLKEIGTIFSELIERWHPDRQSKKLQARLKRYRK